MTTKTSSVEFPLRRRGQFLLGAWSLFLTGGFLLAAWLPPDARGYGTHQRLGLPPCTIQALFQIPCPTCGMTTSFSHFVRGNVLASLEANPAGFALAVVCLLQIPWCWVSIFRRRLWGVAHPDRVLLVLLLGLAALSLIQWLFRLF